MKELIDFLKASFARMTDLPQPVLVAIEWFPPPDVNRDPSFSLPERHEMCVYLSRGKSREVAIVADVSGPVGALVKVISPADAHLGRARKLYFRPSNNPVEFRVHRGEFGATELPQKVSK
jgi:hypothetical protein